MVFTFAFSFIFSLFNTGYNTYLVYSQSITQYLNTRGLVTGSKTEIIGSSSQFINSVSFYDDRGRIIQTQTINQTGGKDTVINQYAFSGKTIRNLVSHQKLGTNVQGHSVLSKMNYDANGRLATLYKNIDNAGLDQLITTNTYNELGQLQNKQLGNNLDNLANAYNIRGWLTSKFALSKNLSLNKWLNFVQIIHFSIFGLSYYMIVGIHFAVYYLYDKVQEFSYAISFYKLTIEASYSNSNIISVGLNLIPLILFFIFNSIIKENEDYIARHEF